MYRAAIKLLSANRASSAILRAALALSAALAYSASASAAEWTWTGLVGTNWNTGTNWTPTGGLPDSPTATASFTGNALGQVNISANVSTQSLTFSNPTGSYTVTSNAGVSLNSV